MVSVYDLKPRFQALLRPITGWLARRGVTANQVTVGAALLSMAVGAAVYWYAHEPRVLLLLPGLLFVRMALNAIDGMLAREHGQKSDLGAFLNELGDVIADSALFLPLAVVPGFDARLVVTVTVLAVVSEMTGVVGASLGSSRRYDGPMGKSDRALWFGVIALLVGCGVAAGTWVTVALAVMTLGLVVTIGRRVHRSLAEIAA